jgi:hypothetical protein
LFSCCDEPKPSKKKTPLIAGKTSPDHSTLVAIISIGT